MTILPAANLCHGRSRTAALGYRPFCNRPSQPQQRYRFYEETDCRYITLLTLLPSTFH